MHTEPHNTPSFISFNQVYALSANSELANFTWGLPQRWFPAEFEGELSGAAETALQEEGRYQIRVLVHEESEPGGYRFADIVTLWFDGQPFAVVQRGGRAGRDAGQTWVTNLKVKLAALVYLIELQYRLADADDFDTTDPDEEVAVETMFGFYGDLGAKLGYPCTPPASPQAKQLTLVSGDVLSEVLPNHHDYVVVASRDDVVPDWLRRGECYLAEPRPLSDEENQGNPRVRMVFQQQGFPYVWVFKILPRPAHYREILAV